MKTFLNYLLNKQWVLSIVMRFLSDDKKERIYIARLRAELAYWGHDVFDMTDEEIKDGHLKVGEISKQCGVAAQELAEVLTAMNISN